MIDPELFAQQEVKWRDFLHHEEEESLKAMAIKASVSFILRNKFEVNAIETLLGGNSRLSIFTRDLCGPRGFFRKPICAAAGAARVLSINHKIVILIK